MLGCDTNSYRNRKLIESYKHVQLLTTATLFYCTTALRLQILIVRKRIHMYKFLL